MKENLSKERIEQINAIYSGWFKKLQSKGRPYNELLSILIRASGRYFGIYEEWKDIPGYELLYEASDFGRIKSLKFKRGNTANLLKPCINKIGYLRVNLYQNKCIKMIAIHQLVAVLFLSHTTSKKTLVINHKNLIKTNNIVYNLEIVTHRENSNRKHLPSSSKFTGVYWNKIEGKWRSSIFINNKSVHLGYFSDEYQASVAYETALKNIK
jgi:hypothetical protein